MANPAHSEILAAGVDAWNRWRNDNPHVEPDLGGMKIVEKRSLNGVDFSRTNLRGARLAGTSLFKADLSKANLAGANLRDVFAAEANLVRADFSEADLSGTIFAYANFEETNLQGANLQGANLQMARLVRCKMARTNLTGCQVYGVSAWSLDLTGAVQTDLIISRRKTPLLTADSLEMAQFLNLLRDSQKIRHVIETITSKVVLILGRFTPERKAILDAIRDELRKRDYMPVLFDFEKPSNRDITETVSTLAHMARFVIADITDAKGIPQELMAIVPALPSVPVQPLLLASQREYGMFEHFKRFPWVLEPYLYEDQDGLLAAITEKVIGPAEAKAKERPGR